MDYHIYIISKGRPQNVAKMQRWLYTYSPLHYTWMIDPEDMETYPLEAPRGTVFQECPTGLARKRNLALDLASKQCKVCVQLDDDLVSLKFTPDFVTRKDATLNFVLEFLIKQMYDHNLWVAGVNLGDNLRFAKPIYPTHLPLPGGMFAARPGSLLRFDEHLLCMEDIDFYYQHLVHDGGCLRVTNILPRFGGTKKAAGGCQTYRTPHTEYLAAQYLQKKWSYTHPGPQWRKFFEFKTNNSIQKEWLERHKWNG